MRVLLLLACGTLLLASCRALGSGATVPLETDAYRIRVDLDESEGVARDPLVRAARQELLDFAENGRSKADIDDAAYSMEAHLRASGYARARVDYEFDSSADLVQVVFVVRSGARYRLEHLEIAGEIEVDERELRSFFGGADGSEPFVEAELATATREARAWLRSLGYRDAVVALDAVELDPAQGSARARVRLSLGVRHVIGGVRTTGLDEAARLDLEPRLSRLTGTPYTSRSGFQLRTWIEEWYLDRGYPDVDVRVELLDPGDVEHLVLTASVEPGVAVRVSSVEVRGERSIRDGVVLAFVGIDPGDPYSRTAVRKGAARLRATGLFRNLDVRLEGTGEERALVVELEQLRSVELWAEPGVGAYIGPYLRLGLRESDLFGTARSASIQTLLSTRERSAKLRLTDPWLFGGFATGDVAFELMRREEPSFTFEERGAGVFLTRHWTPAISTTAGYEIRNTDVVSADFQLAPEEAQEIVDDVDIAALVVSGTLDLRSDRVGAALGALDVRGSVTELQAELGDDAYGSELEFWRVRVEHARYWPLDDATSLALSVRAGAIGARGSSTAIPIQERFFNGGTDSVRSFRPSELGPKDPLEEPLGGEGRTIGSIELRRRLWGSFQGAAFWDAGTVAEDYTELLELRDVRHGIGLGVRYALPVGPLRFDVGWNPDPKEGEDDWVAHFSIGLAY